MQKSITIIALLFLTFARTSWAQPDEGKMTRTEAFRQTINAFGNLEKLAEACQCSKNLLYRASLDPPVGCDLTLHKIESLIATTGDFTLLDYLNNRFGFFKCRPPKTEPNRYKISSLIENLQIIQINASRAIRKFYASQDERSRQRAERALYKLIEIAESARRQINAEWQESVSSKQ
ncbi:MAG: phage regulatory CII family protein [bacterium]